MNMISVGAKRGTPVNDRMLTTRKVSKRGTINIAKPIAGADSRGNPREGSAAISINFITKTEFNRPISKESCIAHKNLCGRKIIDKECNQATRK